MPDKMIERLIVTVDDQQTKHIFICENTGDIYSVDDPREAIDLLVQTGLSKTFAVLWLAFASLDLRDHAKFVSNLDEVE